MLKGILLPSNTVPKLLFAYILLTFDSYAQMCCKHCHMIFSTFSLKFKCKICVQKEVIHNFKNHILAGDHLQTFLFTSFSGHRPAQRECARMRLKSHVRCHPYPIPQPVKVDHTTRVYGPYSFRIVMWVLLHFTCQEQISESAVRHDLRFFVLIRED